MSFAKGTETTEFKNEIKVGVIPYILKAVCPDLHELKAIYGENVKEINYITKPGEKQVSVVFIFEEYDPNTNKPTGNLIRHYHFLKYEAATNKDLTKVEVINQYGDSAWVTNEEFDQKLPPSYNKDFILPYKKCIRGESGLIDFIKTYIGIPNVNKYENGGWVQRDNLNDCKASFTKEHLEQLTSGDFTYLKQILSYQPDNKIKFYTGVRTTENGQYATLLFESPIRYAASKYTSAIKQSKYVMENNDEIYFPEETKPHIFENNTTTKPNESEYGDLNSVGNDLSSDSQGSFLSDGLGIDDDLPF